MHIPFRTLCLLAIALFAVFPAMAADFVVVIDAGHGGKDFGALGNFAYEKDINLGVALKLGKMIEDKCRGVKVVYTRDNDTFVSLQGRAEIANKAHGDLFISIHTNSVDKRSKSRNTVWGSATYTLGLHRSAENLNVAKRENSVIELEDDYSMKYSGFDPNSTESYIIFELSQNKHMEQSVTFASMVQHEFGAVGRKDNGVRQAGFWVLAKTSMPAVLVELDFICNPKQEKYLASDSGQKELAKAIFTAFSEYRDAYYSTPELSGKALKKDGKKRSAVDKEDVAEKGKTKEKSSDTDVSKDSREEVYKVQFMTSGKQLSLRSPYLKDMPDVDWYREKGLYKYTSGNLSDEKEANKLLEKVQKRYKDAFIVVFKSGKRIK